MIEMVNVKKKYPNGVLAVNGINVKIKQGEFVYVVGPSGAGKSTFIKMMYREEKPSAGSILINGVDLAKLKEKKVPNLRRNIGVVFQDFKLLPRLTVFENVELPLLYLGFSSSDRKKKVNAVLEKMEIMHRRSHFPQQLSGGQQQRVAVSRAIVSNPKIILADEPTGNLDSSHGDEVMNMLTQLNEQGTTILMVTHSPTYADYGNRIIHLFDGHVVTENLKEEFHV